MMVKFDPKKHPEDTQLWEMQSQEGTKPDVIAAKFVESTVLYKDAVKAPWWYAVKE